MINDQGDVSACWQQPVLGAPYINNLVYVGKATDISANSAKQKHYTMQQAVW